MSSRSTRVGVDCTTSISRPCTEKRSPGTGMRPASSTSRPPIDRGAARRKAGLEAGLDRLARGTAVGLEHAGADAGRPPPARRRPRSRRPDRLEQVVERHDARPCRRTRRAPRPGAGAPAACRSAGRRRRGSPGRDRDRTDRERSTRAAAGRGRRRAASPRSRPASRDTPGAGCIRSGRTPGRSPASSRPPRSPRSRCAASSPRAPDARRNVMTPPTSCAARPRRRGRRPRLRAGWHGTRRGTGAIGRKEQRQQRRPGAQHRKRGSQRLLRAARGEEPAGSR